MGPPVFTTVKPGLGVGSGAAGCDGEQGHPPASPVTLGAWRSMVCCWWLAECELKMGYFNKDQPFKTCQLSRQIFFSLSIRCFEKILFFLSSYKTVN